MTDHQLRWAVAAIGIYMAACSALLRKSGVKVNQLTADGNVVQRVIVASGVLFNLYLLCRAPFPEIDCWTATRPSPSSLTALITMLVGGAIMVAAQNGMGRSWRIGVPATANEIETLVTGGLNRLSRNPVYLGIMIFLVGTGLAAPGPLSLAAIVLLFVAFTFIIDREEIYLKEKFGAEYVAYAARVRRWI